MYYGGWWFAGLIWLAVVIYGLILATRFVRAIERMADALGRGKPPG
ncbi:MAG: hypothetical protein HY700_13525 [Gemmatimonadetes bacterium]|nr:hypothetical protein [Gemmatimonadota bacterium]